MGWLKWMAISIGIIIALVLVIVTLFSIYTYRLGTKKSQTIDELSKVAVGTSVNDVLKLALELGIEYESQEFAIPYPIEIVNNDNPSKNPLPEKVTKNTDLSNFKNGKLNFGLSLFLFSRKGCEMTIQDGRVVSTRIWYLD